MVGLNCALLSVVVWVCLQTVTVNGQAGTLGFYLNGVAYPNGSTVLRTDIGLDDAALQCTTNSVSCCSTSSGEMRGGELYFPDDEGLVPIMVASLSQGYYRNRGSQFIRLNRWANGTTTGQFRCEIPDATGEIAMLFINIVDIRVSITPYGNSTAGGIYSLECSAAVNGSTEQTDFTWLSPGNAEVPSEMVNTTNSTSTLTFDPLSLPHVGTYTCRVVLEGVTQTRTWTVAVESGVSLSLGGTPLPNNSFVDVDDIGEGGVGGASDVEGLLCLTSKQDCCSAAIVGGDTPLGQWFFPNESVVHSKASNIDAGREHYFFRNRFQSVVRLLQVGRPPERGLFRCEVPNAYDVNQTLYVTIVDVFPTPTSATFLPTTTLGLIPSPTPTVLITVITTSSGSNHVGGALNLTCSAMIVGSSGQPTIMWLDSNSREVAGDGDNSRARVSPPTVSTDGSYFSSLMFNPLVASDAGLFMCKVTLGRVAKIENVTVTINSSILQLSDDSEGPLLGQNYSLTCNLLASVSFSYTFQWRKDSAVLNEAEQTLSFSQLRLSDAGQYTCEVTGITTILSNTLNVSLQVPSPEVMITNTSTPYNGTVFNLTSAIQLDRSNVDIGIAVSWRWSLGENTLRIQETLLAPHQSSLSFQPLATNSSGVYRLSVTLTPLDDSPFIVESSNSSTYDLSVLPLPSRPPSIRLISRQPSLDDFCGEAMTFSCTADPVDGILTPPIITWVDPRGDLVPEGGNNNPKVESQTRNLVFSDVTANNGGVYMCRAVINIPLALIDNHFDESSMAINTSFPGQVKNLTCADRSTPDMLHLSWKRPTFLGSEVVDYKVEVRELQHRSGAQKVTEVPIRNLATTMETYNISQGLKSEVPYNITVKARNLAGCGSEQQIFCFTQEGEPPTPINVTVARFNSTTVGVSWAKFTLVELKGLASYVVSYTIIIASRKRVVDGTFMVPWTNNSIIITNLQAGAQYRISVRTSTSAGMSEPVEVSTDNVPPAVLSNTDTVIAIVCGVVSVVVILAVAAIVIAALKFALKIYRQKSFNLNTRSINSPFMMANEFYQSSEDTLTKMEFESFDHHAYETVDKYSESYINRHAPQPYLEIEIRSPPAQPTQKANGFTECPLYASASFDNAADGKQTAESSFSQKMSVPGDAARPAVTNEEEERYVINEFEEGGADSTYATVR